MKYIDHFYSYKTYAGSLEGSATSTVIYNSIRRRAEQLWDMRATHIVEPTLKQIKGSIRDYEVFPQWTHMAWVNGPPISKSEGVDGSSLVIVWFSEESCFNGYDDVVNGVDWNKHAEDYGW
jgi:hypothetical protein